MPRNGTHARRRAEKERQEAALKKALSHKERPDAAYMKEFGGSPFRDLPKKHRKIVSQRQVWPVLWRLHGFRDRWVRPLDEWTPRGKAAETVLRSLIDHLICRYKMPAFWFSVWFGGRREAADAAQSTGWFVALSQGTGMYELVKRGDFPVKLTKKQCHAFMQQRGVNNVVEAVRWTQVQSFGGERRFVEALCKTDWGDELRQEEFRAPVIQWFCTQAMIDPAQVGPMIDYLEHAKRQFTSRQRRLVNEAQDEGRIYLIDAFSMKGRTARSVMRDMEAWHKELAENRRVARREDRAQWGRGRSAYQNPPPAKFAVSGFENWGMNRKTKDKRTGKSIQVHYSIRELLTYDALLEEGRMLSHCVSSYAWSIGKGQKSIWSFSIGKDKQLTIEVRNSTRTVVQIRGLRNRMPEASEMLYVEKWARENGLAITGRAGTRGW